MRENERHNGGIRCGHTARSCGCSGLSRRSFLGTMALGAAALGTGCVRTTALFAPPRPKEVIDLGAFRPRPTVRIMTVVVREKPPYWLGWPGTSYDLEGWRKRYAETFEQCAKRVGVQLIEESQPLEEPESVGPFLKKVAAEKPDAVLIHIQHIRRWPMAGEIAKAGVPTIVFSPVGMAFTGHVKSLAFQKGVHVISSLDTRAVEQAFRMVRTKRQLAETKLLVLRGTERKEEVLGNLGVTVRTIPRVTFEEMFQQTPVSEEARYVAYKRFKEADDVIEPTKEDGLNAARSFIAAKQILKNEGCNALTTDCLGMVTQKKVPTPPCMAASIFQDAGVTYGCEAAVWPAVSLMLTSYLFDKPGFMNDPVPETVKNVLIAAHCVSGTKIYGLQKDDHAPFILRSHSESNLGVSTQVLWPEGKPVTLVLFTKPDSLIVDTGRVVGNVQTPPAGGCRTSVEIAMDNIEDARDVLGFHQVVFYGDHRRDIEAFCQLYGIEAVHSPRTHAEAPPAPPAAPKKKAAEPSPAEKKKEV
ncbi:MAG: hypothetical protein N3D11_14140 [Candidatus Sumerlaeia bacterium]|nr:hypothetical protein [Candidatus Sumerlaeia bacterium]